MNKEPAGLCHPNRQWYNWLAYDMSERQLASYAPLYKGVLYDLGAGESAYKPFFLRYADRYVAVDWADSLHDIQADVIADLNGPLPIESAVADTVVSLSVMEHLREPQRMLDESFRILRPGGHIVVQVPWQWWVHESPHDYFRYTPHALQYLFGKAGFEDIAIAPMGGFASMMVLKANYFSLRLIGGPSVVRSALRGLLALGWYVGQKLAPVLDRFDRQWELETSGYFVTARKP